MRLIDVSHAIKLLRKIRNDYPADSVKHKMLNMVISILANPQQTPTVDAAPVVRGRWRFCGSDRWNDAYECSECGKIAMDDSNYCTNCGAKMDLKEE